MLRIPKDMEGRRLDILVQGLPTIEIKVAKINDDEIIGEYADGEEVHVSHNAVRVWWVPKRQPLTKEQIEKRKRSKMTKDTAKSPEKAESTEEETDTPEEKEDWD
jgi:hypothetical protein